MVRIDASLEGTWRREYRFALKQGMQRYDFLEMQITQCYQAILAELDQLAPRDPDDPARAGAPECDVDPETALHQALERVLGVDLTAVPTTGLETTLTIAAEIGPDLSQFESRQHFCSLLGLAPGTRITGDRKLTTKGSCRPIELARRCGCRRCQRAAVAAISAANTGRG